MGISENRHESHATVRTEWQEAQQLVDTVPVKYLIAETAPQILGLGMYYRFTSALTRELDQLEADLEKFQCGVGICRRSEWSEPRTIATLEFDLRPEVGTGQGAVVDTSTKPRVVRSCNNEERVLGGTPLLQRPPTDADTLGHPRDR